MHAALGPFHPLVATWFHETFGEPSPPQVDGWPAIAAGQDVLIAAPTGSGKTLAAFLACLDELLRRSLVAPLPDRIAILYISPLKALSNDVQRNLDEPLAALAGLARARPQLLDGKPWPTLRTGVRTGDTPAAERERMAKHPPHILVSTPESLYILLTTARGRAALSSVRTVIVDEIHAVAKDKRGAHLALTLERLDRLVSQHGNTPPIRVGLSATQKPIARVARLLVGHGRTLPRIVDSGHRRALDLAIEITDDELGPIASHEQMGRMYDRIAELALGHRSTLVFVNTRRLVERVAAALEQRLGEAEVVAHHGSMSRAMRLAAEEKLKYGKVRLAVATASLELGIDVGTVDLVVQIGSPRAIGTFLQRVGRSGHQRGGTPKGRLFALTRDQLLECAALVRGVEAGVLDELELREAPLDILAQQIVAICAAETSTGDAEASAPPQGVLEAELAALVRRAANYGELSEAQLEQVLQMLSEGMSDRRGRNGAHLHRDRVTGMLRARKGARLAAIMSGGAIPDNNNYAVVQHPEAIRVGEVDEDFAIDSSAGDIFQLGNTSWRIQRIEVGKVIVEDASGQPPTIPFWFGEAPARTNELSAEVGRLRQEMEASLATGLPAAELATALTRSAHMSLDAANQLVAYLTESYHALGALPSQTTLIAERFFDEGGGMQLVLHAPLGGRINRALGLALRKKFCRSFNFELQAAATDDGIVISLGQPHSFALESVFQFLTSHNAREVLIQAMLDQPMFEIRWRWNVTRALAVQRRKAGQKVAPHLVKMRAADLLSVVFPQAQACLETVVGDREVPDHPLVFETVRDCLVEALDDRGLIAALAALEAGTIQIVARDTVAPSPLSHELISANPYAFLDDAALEDRRTRAVSLRRGLAQPGESLTALTPQAIAQAAAEAAPVVRSLDELHDALLGLWLVPTPMALALHPHAATMLATLASQGRATQLAWSHASQTVTAWVPIERLALVHAILPPCVATPTLALPAWAIPAAAPEPELVMQKVVGAHLDCAAPLSTLGLADQLGLPVESVYVALLALEADGAILRGTFTHNADAPRPVAVAMAAVAAHEASHQIQWCNRRILARIHHLTLATLRKEIEPVSPAVFMRFLLRWQRLAPGAQLLGVNGLHTVIAQLQGFETAAGAWERELLPARILNYAPELLDQLCLTGQATWCRLSPRRREAPQATGQSDSASDRTPNFTPRRAAPLGFLRREDAGWLRAAARMEPETSDVTGFSEEAERVRSHLQQRGASFLAELVRGCQLTPEATENALWELVAAGVATADGYAALRVLVDKTPGQVRSHHDLAPIATGATNWREAINRTRQRDRQRPSSATHALPSAAGRWSLLPEPDTSFDGELIARQLLERYGVIFRDLLARETGLPPWRDILMACRRLEARGELRGGRFVAGMVGEQYALPQAVDQLRAAKALTLEPSIVEMSACDPLNLVGILTPGPRVSAVVGNRVLWVDGVAVASLEAGEVKPRAELPDGARVVMQSDRMRYLAPEPDTAPRGQLALLHDTV